MNDLILFLIVVAVGAVGVGRLYRLVLPPAPQLPPAVRAWDRGRARSARHSQRETATTATAVAVGPALAPVAGIVDRQVGTLAEKLRDQLGPRMDRVDQDLALTESTLEEWLTRALGTATAGFVVPAFLMIGVGRFPVLPSLVTSLAVAGFVGYQSFAELRDAAEERRAELNRAFSTYLDLVVLAIEGGRGYVDALHTAALTGSGWAFTQLRDAVDKDAMRVAGITPWEGLGRLGERLGLPALIELRTTLTLAQDDGARVRATLVARAETMREARLAEAEAAADKATESMKLNLLAMAMVIAAAWFGAPLLNLMNAT